MEKQENKSEAEVLRKKAEDLLKKKSEAEILELVQELAFQNEEKAKQAAELDIANKELVFQNEEKAKRADELSVAIENSLKLSHEHELFQTELKMQNEELQAARSAAVALSEKYLELYDFAPSGYFTLSGKGEIIELNLSGAKMLGIDRQQLINCSFDLFVSEDTGIIFSHFLENVFNSEAKESCEVNLATPGNLSIFVHLSGIASENGTQCMVTAIDITERKLAQQKLQASEDRYRSIFQGSPDGIFIADTETKMITYANWAQCRAFGYTEEEFKTMSIADIHPQDTFLRTLEEFESILHGIKAIAENIPCLKKNGELFYADISGALITINGRAQLLGFFRDITVRKITEQKIHDLNVNLENKIAERTIQLAESNAKLEIENAERHKISTAFQESLDRLNKIADRVPGVVYQYRLNPDGSSCFPFASEGIRDIFQVSPEEVAHDASIVFSRLHPDDFEGFASSIQTSAKEMKIWHHEYRMIGKNVRWFMGNAMPQENEDGSILWHGYTSDITERKLAEKALLESEIKHSSMISNISDVIGIIGADGVMSYKSPNIEKHFGWKPQDLIGTIGWSTVHPDDLERIQLEFYTLLQTDNSSTTVQYKYKCKDGSYKPIELTATNLVNNSIINGILLNYHDITVQKQAKEALIAARNEADRANLAKSEFLSHMSHELRTPMNSILGFAQLMEMGELKPSHKKWVNNIKNSGKHLLSLINEVLELAGIESGRQILISEPVGISDIIHDISDMLQIQADSRNITIVHADSPDHDLFVFADKRRLRQVLLNIASNAIKYNREGGLVTINTELHELDKDGNASVRISIKDTGNGINPEDITKLFQAFERIGADRTTTEGTGLGLVVVKELTKAMKGTFGVESEVGIGSTFWIELPYTKSRKSYKQQKDENIKLTSELNVARNEIDFQNEEKGKT